LEEEGELTFENELLPLREEDMMNRRLISSVLPAKGISCLLDFIILKFICHRLLALFEPVLRLFSIVGTFQKTRVFLV
jgi:hypothetical protein